MSARTTTVSMNGRTIVVPEEEAWRLIFSMFRGRDPGKLIDDLMRSGPELVLTGYEPEECVIDLISLELYRKRETVLKVWSGIMCENVGQGFIWGCLVGMAFNFFKGVFNSPPGNRLSGGYETVKKEGPFRFGSLVAAHYGLSTFLRLAVTKNPVVTCAASLGIIRLFCTRNLAKASKWALGGGFLVYSLNALTDGKKGSKRN